MWVYVPVSEQWYVPAQTSAREHQESCSTYCFLPCLLEKVSLTEPEAWLVIFLWELLASELLGSSSFWLPALGLHERTAVSIFSQCKCWEFECGSLELNSKYYCSLSHFLAIIQKLANKQTKQTNQETTIQNIALAPFFFTLNCSFRLSYFQCF